MQFNGAAAYRTLVETGVYLGEVQCIIHGGSTRPIDHVIRRQLLWLVRQQWRQSLHWPRTCVT